MPTEFFNKNKANFMKYEIEAGKIIETTFNKQIIETCNSYKYDFKTNDNVTYEVKAEPTCLRTNNFYIEFFAYGKPSGLNISESNYYIITDTINFYLIETIKLKELISTNTFTIKQTKDKKTYGYLINKEFIIKNSVCIY